MDLVRAVVTGPPDTPYSLGCFAFDIYFPATYPNNPPLVKLITTGNGTVRFEKRPHVGASDNGQNFQMFFQCLFFPPC